MSLPATMWLDGVKGDQFAYAEGDVVNIKMDAYTSARRNALRSGAPRSRDKLAQRKVPVKLTTRLYKDIPVSDEEFTLDIVDFTKDVMGPCLRSLVRGWGEEAATLIGSPTNVAGPVTYEHEIDLDEENPYRTLTRARKLLNLAQVPLADRHLSVGADVEEFILNAANFQQNLASSGDASALRDAQAGRVAGFNVGMQMELEPDEACAYHRSAFALANVAPKVPSGAPWGATETRNGLSMRAVQVLDPDTIQNILATEVWVGGVAITDFGSIGDNGKFTPGEDPEDPEEGEADRFVRAVKINAPSSS